MKPYEIATITLEVSIISCIVFLYIRELMVFRKKKKRRWPSLEKKKPKDDKLKRADDGFSLFIRTEFSKNGYCTCYTCGKKFEIKSGFYGIHCGHLISRKYWRTRFDKNNCRPQCHDCNVNKRGLYARFLKLLTEELGIVKIQEMMDTKDPPCSPYERNKIINNAFKEYDHYNSS